MFRQVSESKQSLSARILFSQSLHLTKTQLSIRTLLSLFNESFSKLCMWIADKSKVTSDHISPGVTFPKFFKISTQ